MTKKLKKQLARGLAMLMAVAMLVGTLPADLLGGIASVKAATEDVSGGDVTDGNTSKDDVTPGDTSGSEDGDASGNEGGGESGGEGGNESGEQPDEETGDVTGGDASGGDVEDTSGIITVEIPYTNIYSFVDESIVTAAMDGSTPATSVDGKLTVASSASSTFKRNGNQHGVQMANGGTVTLAVDGACSIIVGGCNYNSSSSTIELNGEVVVANGTKTAACPEYTDLSAGTLTSEENLANCFVIPYEGEAGDVVLTFNGTNYVPYIIVTGTITKTVMEKEYTNIYSFVDESIVTAAMDGSTPATSVDGKLTVASSASSTFKRNGNQHGVQMANGGTVTLAVDGACTIIVGGCNYNSSSSTIELNGEVVVANGTKTAACPEYTDLSAETLTSEANLANCFVIPYEGEAGDVVLTFNGTNYVPYIIVSGTEQVEVEEYTSVYSFVDESIVTAAMDGSTPATSADGKLTVASSASSTFKRNGNQHGVQMANGGTVTLAVDGDSTIIVGGCNYNSSSSTIELNGEVVVANGTKTAACPEYTDLSVETLTSETNLANCFVIPYEGEAGDVVLTFNGTNYVPYIIVSGIREVAGTVNATIAMTGTELLQPGDKVTLTNSADASDVFDVSAGDVIVLQGGSIYNVAVSNPDIAASIDGRTMVATADADLEITIDLVATVVHPVVTINDPDGFLGEGVVTLTNMADDTDVVTLTNGESAKLKKGASYLVGTSVAAATATIAGSKTLAVGDELDAITVDIEETDLTHHTIDVWDFGVEALENTELITYNNHLTADLVLAWYEGLTKADGTPYAAGDSVASGVLGWDANKQAKKLDAGNGLYLFGVQNKANAWRHRCTNAVTTIPKEAESALTDEYGASYQGIMYSNAGSTLGSAPYQWFELDVSAGDIVWAVVSSNGTDSLITFESPSGDKQTYNFTRKSRTLLANTCEFYAAEEGTYTIYSANEKLVVARLYKETPGKGIVSGTVSVPEGKDISGVSIVFTNDITGEQTVASIENNAYSVTLTQQYSYSLSLSGINDVIVGLTSNVELENEEATKTYDVDLVAVELVDVGGSLAVLDAEAAADLKLTFSSENIYVPVAKIDTATQTYTASFEQGVTYTVSEAGVDDYKLETTSVSADVSTNDLDIVFTKKPVYDINVTLDGPTATEAAAAEFTFSRLAETDGTVDGSLDGYVYTFTGTEDIALRDGQYKVVVALDGYNQKVTADVKVNGAAVDRTIVMLSTATPDPVEYKETITVGATDCDYTTINDALDAVRLMERTEEQRVTIAIQPGDYQEMLVVDVPNVTLKNASETPSNAVNNYGVGIDENAVRITSYYGHGYTYYSMGSDCKYDADLLAVNKENGYPSFVNPGSGSTAGSYWNATVVVSADGFQAEGIIFENAFNQYVSTVAADDVIVAQGGAKGEALGARAEMEAGDTSVQQKEYVERAAALALQNGVQEAFFDNCRIIGKQDTLYGGTGTTAAFYDCAIYGGTDFIFGGMTAVFAKCDLVLHTVENNNDVAYITAAQQTTGRGYLMYNCNVVNSTPGVDTIAEEASKPGYFGRPWQAETSEVVFYYTVVGVANDGTSLIAPDGWNSSLSGTSDKVYEYGTYEMAEDVDNSASRVSWAKVLAEPVIDEDTIITVPKFLGAWKAFEGKDMTIELPNGATIEEPTDSADDAYWEEEVVTTFVLEATTLTPIGTAADANDGVVLTAGTNDYFQVILSNKTKIDSSNKTWEDGYSSSQRINFGGALTALSAGGYKNAIKFTTSNAATVKVWWAAGDTSRQVAIYNEAGATVATTEGTWTKNSPYLATLEVESAGTYYLGNTDGSNYIFKVEVEEEKAAEPIVSDLEATTLTPIETAADANDGVVLTAGTNDYFQVILSNKTKIDSSNKTWEDGYSSSQRINFGGAMTALSTGGYKNAIKFTTEYPATVKVWWAAGDTSRQVAIYNEAGATVATTEGTWTKNSPYLAELELESAGTYYLGNTVGSNYIFKVQVTETPDGAVEVPRADWETVAAPEILSVALHVDEEGEVDDNKIDVTVKGYIEHDGGDRLEVDMLDENDKVIATVGSAKLNTAEDPTNVVSFTPSDSGSYTFVARLTRMDGEDAEGNPVTYEPKVSAVSEAFAFSLPLTTPVIKSVTNKGLGEDEKGTLEIVWGAVKEALCYQVIVSKTVETVSGNDTIEAVQQLARVTTAELNTMIGGLDVGDKVTVSITAFRGEDQSEAATKTTTITAEAQRTWSFSAYGSSTSLSSNGFEEHDDNMNGEEDAADTDGLTDSVTVYSQGGKGKVVPGSTDGLAFYYTTIDPMMENFTLTADVHVDTWTLSNAQEGFGLMVADAVGESGDGTAFWNNSYQLFATKIEYNWDTVNNCVTTAAAGENGIIRQSGKMGLGWIAKEGTTATDVAKITAGELSLPENFSSTNGTLETYSAALNPTGGQFNIVGNAQGAQNTLAIGKDNNGITDFKLQIQRNNDGYVLRYLDEDGEVIGEKLFYDDNRNKLSQIDKKNVYVGFVASRNAKATFSNIELTTIDPELDAPATEKETTYVDPSYQILSATTANSEDYTMVFYGNADGKLTIMNDAGEVVVNEAEITAKKKFSVNTTLHDGDNKFEWAFVPNADYVPGAYQALSSYEKAVASFHVNYESFEQDVIYVAPTGSGMVGTKEEPTDIYTAVAYAKAGQTIYLTEGTYELNNVLIDRGHDGTEDAYINLWADPDATTRPVLDFTNQTGSASAMILAGNYWHLKGFDVTNSMNAQKGLQVSGSYNVVEDVDAYRNGNTGIQISRYLGSDKYAEWPSYNTILNCTSYLNADAGYEDADGFAAKLTVADGNKFVGCIAAYNADDGWDLFAKVESGAIGAVTIENSIAFKNGYMLGTNNNNTDPGDDIIDPYMDGAVEFSAGNGNGFKMGGDSMSGHHVIKNSIAFANKAKGIDSNSCPDIEVYNCTSFDNESYNVALYTNTAVNTAYIADGILSVKSMVGGVAEQLKLLGTQKRANVYSDTNYYYDGTKSANASGAEASTAWFKSIDTTAAIKGGITRDADGSINMNGYLELTDAALASTNVGARLGSTSADIVLEKPIEISVFAANVKKLEDINLADFAQAAALVADGYTWADPMTATAVFAGTTTEFIVSSEVAGKEDKYVIVNLVEFTGVEVYERNGKQGLYGEDTVTLIATPVFVPEVDNYSDILGYDESTFSASIVESDKLKLDVGIASYAGEALADVKRKSDSKEGIAKFTATIKATLGNKVVTKKGTFQFTVKAEQAGIDYELINVNDVSASDLVGAVTADVNDVFKFTKLEATGLSKTDVKVTVNDSKVLKYDAKAKTLTAKAEGTATVTLTAAADKKVVAKIVVTVRGAALKTNVTTLTVDRAKLVGAQFTAVACYDESLVKGSVYVKSAIKSKKDYSRYLALDNVIGNVYAISTIENPNATASSNNTVADRMPTGTYVLTLAGKLDGSDAEVEFATVTLKVTESKPTVTVKQTKKVNLFYNPGVAAGNGAITATSKQAAVTLKEYSAAEYQAIKYTPDYKLSGNEIVLKPTAASKKVKKDKITVVASFEGYKSSYNKTVTVKVGTQKVKPKLKAEVDNTVLYTQLGINGTELRIWDVASGTYLTSADVTLADSTKAYVNANKNFTLEDGILGTTKTGTAKISVLDPDWTEPVILSQKLTVNTKAPTATFGKLTLNSAYAGKEQAEAKVTVKNALDYEVRLSESDTVSGSDIVGKNAKSKALYPYMNWSVDVNDEGENVLYVSLDADVPASVAKAGSYSFAVTYGLYAENAAKDAEPAVEKTATVTVKLVNKATVTTKQSGSIDLANRTGSSVTVKPTLKNLNGTVVGMKLNKEACNQFNVAWDSAKGAAVVTVKEGIDMKKGGKYKVTPTFIVETEGGNVEIVAKVITITPKQSTVKTTKLTTLETRLSAPSVAAKATFKSTSPAGAEVLDMIQGNYLENFAVTYDNESDMISVKLIDAAGLQAGKTYKIKMYLEVEGSGVTTKAQSVTVSVKVVK